MSSSFVCERPRRLWTNSITVGIPARATSAASCSGPLGRRCDVPATSVIASSARAISGSSKRIGSIDQIRSQATSIVLLGGEPLGGRLRLVEHRGELARVEVALVEQLLGRLDDRGDDPRPADDAAARADRAVARLGGDPADVERELGGAGERVAAAGPSASSRRGRPGRVQVIRWRSTPNVPSTTPSGRSSASSTGPCSMCSSR